MTSKAELKEQLDRQLHVVRDELDECLEQFGLRLQSRLEDVLEALNSGAKRGGATARELRELLDEVEQMRVKPRKGRAKDLRRLAKAVDDAWEVLCEEK